MTNIRNYLGVKNNHGKVVERSFNSSNKMQRNTSSYICGITAGKNAKYEIFLQLFFIVMSPRGLIDPQ